MGDNLKQPIFCRMKKIVQPDKAVRSIYLVSEFINIKTGRIGCEYGFFITSAVQFPEEFGFDLPVFKNRFDNDIRIFYIIIAG